MKQENNLNKDILFNKNVKLRDPEMEEKSYKQ